MPGALPEGRGQAPARPGSQRAIPGQMIRTAIITSSVNTKGRSR